MSRADQIGLTAEQTDQINQARRAQREASINRRAAAEIAELELRELMGADTPDIAAVEAKLRELAEQHIAEQTTALRLNASVGEILTSDQLADLSRGRGRDRGSRREREPACQPGARADHGAGLDFLRPGGVQTGRHAALKH